MLHGQGFLDKAKFKILRGLRVYIQLSPISATSEKKENLYSIVSCSFYMGLLISRLNYCI